MKHPKNIVITGASSGLGAALAAHYAAAGITLHLQGRDCDRLSETVKTCESKGATVHSLCLDVTDSAGMSAWLHSADAASPIDLIIANAGISAGTGFKGESPTQVETIFAVNVNGVINSIHPLLEKMIARRRGQLAIMSSLAGIRGLPSSPAYSASKACVRVYGEGLRGWLASQNVQVSVICPGFIRTPMTAINPYDMPLMLDAPKAASIIAGGLRANRPRIAFPLRLYWLLLFMNLLPLRLTDALFARLPAKPSL